MAGKRVVSTKLFWFGREIKKKYGSIALKAAEAGGQVILKNLEKNISIPGRATGHPYARHHRTGSKGTEYPWQVHKPGSGLKTFGPTVVARRDRASAIVGLNPTTVAYYIVYGTSKMVPRNVVWKSAGEVRREVRETVRSHFSAGIKTGRRIGVEKR